MEPRIEIDKKTGSRTLFVYYDRKLDNYDSEIEKAERQLGLKGERITVIALPAKKTR